jgi:hypothetical protein
MDIANADTDWATRKPRLRVPGWPRRKIQSTASITRYPSTSPTTGDTSIGMTTFSTMPPQSTCPPLASRVAPTSPPISAWDEDDGMPNRQVVRFHAIAPIRPASTTDRPGRPEGSVTTPLPTVAATLPPRNDPPRLPTAAMSSATRGVRARVDTEVAMALAASWKPLV